MNVEKSKKMVFKKGEGKEKNTSWNWKSERLEEVKEMLYLGIKMQRKNEKSKCGDETDMGNRRDKVLERLQKKDDTVQPSGCGSHVVRGRTFRLEGKNRM